MRLEFLGPLDELGLISKIATVSMRVRIRILSTFSVRACNYVMNSLTNDLTE